MRKLVLGISVVLVIALMGVLAGCSCSSESQTTGEAAGSSSAVATPNEVTVPDVVFHDSDGARHMITHAGLVVGDIKHDYSDTIPANLVIAQDPAAKTKLKPGEEVGFTVSLGKKAPALVAMPDIIGHTQEDAERMLRNAKLVPIPANPVYSDDVAPGLVCQQSAKAGDQIAEGSQVTFSVSLGKGTVKVPNEMGRSYEDAKAELTGMSLGVDKTESYSDEVAAGLVIAQSVAPGTEVTKGTRVSLNVSLGSKPVQKVAVPDIMTYTLDEAEDALKSSGLTYSYSGDPDGTVNSVNPAPGTEVEVGSMVVFTLQHVSTLVAVPDVSGMNGPDALAAIELAGLDLDYDVRHPDRTLIGTIPAAGSMVDVGTMVEAQYPEEPAPPEQVEIPDVKGMSAKAAAKEFKKIGLTLKFEKDQAKLILENTKPKIGTKVDVGSTVEPVFKKDSSSSSSEDDGPSSSSEEESSSSEDDDSSSGGEDSDAEGSS